MRRRVRMELGSKVKLPILRGEELTFDFSPKGKPRLCRSGSSFPANVRAAERIDGRQVVVDASMGLVYVDPDGGGE